MESKAISSRNYQKLKEKSFFFILDRLGYRPIYVSPLDESQERTTKALQLPPMLQQLQNMLVRSGDKDSRSDTILLMLSKHPGRSEIRDQVFTI